ncbi:hypothetical protein D9Q98_006086 [Chlorella vulgaris]|uniref:Cupin type-2 domain-containing protein n=1 Tax=Chlorella vulgaris TaxID=3077 RepID=A0A9D4TXF0_CHLVU|nr:hypothetical protein D9Q98_006086 [Chlorella vulgaris]
MSVSCYRYCRVTPSCSAQYVCNKLTGAPVHSLPGGRTVVPLLHPQHHSLPFALTLELHARQPERYGDTAKLPRPPQLDPSVFALHYMLAGSGKLVRAGGSEQLQAGDAVLMQSGAAACCVADGDDEEEWSARQPAGGSEAPAWHLAELVAYMPQELFRQPRQQTGQVPLLAAASLQPLLQHASTEVGTLPDSMARELLAGAKATARQALLGGEGPGAQQDGSSSSGDEGGSSNSSSSSAGGSGERLLPFFQSAANSLAGWWQQQQDRTCPVTKRTLAELTAFQMPGQTNRLAVQFDPFSRPEVPFISGIEVFERGHHTQPHVHPHAHELFFILAGQGTAFCGSERFPVTAGDVVVFCPGAIHGIDNDSSSRMYCLELMVPNEQFAEFVRTGTDTGRLAADDLCVLASIGCR